MAISIGNGAEIRPLEKGRKSPDASTCNLCWIPPQLYTSLSILLSFDDTFSRASSSSQFSSDTCLCGVLAGESDSPLCWVSDSPVCGELGSPLCWESDSPVCGEFDSPLCWESDSPVCGELDSPLCWESDSPLCGELDSPLCGESDFAVDTLPGGSSAIHVKIH